MQLGIKLAYQKNTLNNTKELYKSEHKRNEYQSKDLYTALLIKKAITILYLLHHRLFLFFFLNFN
jgi:hypothetical protein